MGLFSAKKDKPKTTAIDAINTKEIESSIAPKWYTTYKTLENFPHIPADDSYESIVMPHEVKEALEKYVQDVMPEPSACFKIYQKMIQGEVNVQEIANLVASDPLLAAKVIKTVNSPAYGFTTRITSVGRAVTLIGLQNIKNLVLSESMKESMKGDDEERKFNEKIRAHSAMVSAVAQHLASRCDKVDGNEIATIALLHDIGKILYRKVLKMGKRIQADDSIPPLMIEAILASAFAELWELPAVLIDALEFVPYPLYYPMDILTSKQCAAVTVVQAANYVVNAIDDAEDGDRLHEIRPEYLLAAGLSVNPSEWILPTMVSNIEKTRSALS